MNLAELSKRLVKINEETKALNSQLKDLNVEKEEITHNILNNMDQMELNRYNVGSTTFTKSETVVPSVKDWDAFYAFIKEQDALWLLERRPAAVAYRDLLEAREGENIPGVEPFTKVSLLTRTAK